MNHQNNPDLASPLTALGELILLSQSRALLRKVIYSKPADRAVKRAVLSPRAIGGKTVLQLETFTADNKALHRNLDPSDSADAAALAEIAAGYGQVNLITTAGEKLKRGLSLAYTTYAPSVAVRVSPFILTVIVLVADE